jgi:hypothetical protein
LKIPGTSTEPGAEYITDKTPFKSSGRHHFGSLNACLIS